MCNDDDDDDNTPGERGLNSNVCGCECGCGCDGWLSLVELAATSAEFTSEFVDKSLINEG
jgi:hypothetical protein